MQKLSGGLRIRIRGGGGGDLVIDRPATLIVATTAACWSSLNVTQIDARHGRNLSDQVAHSYELPFEYRPIPDRHPGISLHNLPHAGARSVWLGVNQRNERANRFYEKQGFAIVGTKRFLVGSRWFEDFVRELVLPAGTA